MELGKQLRIISDSAKTEKEFSKLREFLILQAQDGSFTAEIPDFKKEYPQIFASGEVWDWLKKEGIGFSGGLVRDKYSYTIYW